MWFVTIFTVFKAVLHLKSCSFFFLSKSHWRCEDIVQYVECFMIFFSNFERFYILITLDISGGFYIKKSYISNKLWEKLVSIPNNVWGKIYLIYRQDGYILNKELVQMKVYDCIVQWLRKLQLIFYFFNYYYINNWRRMR